MLFAFLRLLSITGNRQYLVYFIVQRPAPVREDMKLVIQGVEGNAISQFWKKIDCRNTERQEIVFPDDIFQIIVAVIEMNNQIKSLSCTFW